MKSYQQGDIFSFGVILWEIITRKTPWEDSSFENIEFYIKFLSFFFFFFLILHNNIFIINHKRTGKRLEKIDDIEESLKFLEEIIDSSWLENPQLRPTITSILQHFPKS